MASDGPGRPGAPVSWAGLEPAPAWLDAARKLSEYWTHQQQLRDATERPGLAGPELLAAVLDMFRRALPFTLRDTEAEAGAQLQVDVTGASSSRPWGWCRSSADRLPAGVIRNGAWPPASSTPRPCTGPSATPMWSR